MSPEHQPNRRWLQYDLRTLFVLMTLAAALTLPSWYLYCNWWRFQYASDPDLTRERVRSWLEQNSAQAENWQLPGVAGQTQESDLPSSRE